MTAELGTTNLLLGIMAAVSVLQAMLLVGAGIAGLMLYRRISGVVSVVEAHHVAPAMVRVNAILDDLKGVTATVKDETNRVDQAIRSTLERVDDTANRMRSNVRAKTSPLVGFVRGLRVAIDAMRHSEHPHPGRS